MTWRRVSARRPGAELAGAPGIRGRSLGRAWTSGDYRLSATRNLHGLPQPGRRSKPHLRAHLRERTPAGYHHRNRGDGADLPVTGGVLVAPIKFRVAERKPTAPRPPAQRPRIPNRGARADDRDKLPARDLGAGIGCLHVPARGPLELGARGSRL